MGWGILLVYIWDPEWNDGIMQWNPFLALKDKNVSLSIFRSAKKHATGVSLGQLGVLRPKHL